MTDNLGFVSPYLLRPLRTELEAALEVDPDHPVKCSRCGEYMPAGLEPDGCRDPGCPRRWGWE